MKVQKVPHLIFRVIEYGLNVENQFFTPNELRVALNLISSEYEVVKTWIASSVSEANTNQVMVVVSSSDERGRHLGVDNYRCTLLPSAITQYNEYEEIILARRNAEDAREQSQIANRQSLMAIGIALFFGIVQTIISLIPFYRK